MPRAASALGRGERAANRLGRVLANRTAPPLRPPGYVDRPRLRDAIEAAVPLGLALVVAPGGFGKTVALSDFAQQAPFRVAWLAVTPAEADLVAFVEALVAAVRRVVPTFGRRVARVARQAGAAGVAAVGEELARELDDIGQPVGIVLDDFHAADGAPEVAKLIGALVERLPSTCFVAVASRTLPALPHARLLALGRMLGVAADELRFTPDEIASYLGGRSDAERALRLYEKTGGWAAALVLGDSDEPFPAAIEDYFEAEVLGQQATEVAAFLTRAAVPPTLSADMCSRVLGEPRGEEYLRRAHRTGVFVQALPDGGWRLHDLFRDFLRGRLRRGNPAEWTRLHLAVAADLRAAAPGGHPPADAVTLLVDAGLYEEAADLLLDQADAFAAEGRWGAIHHWLEKVPAPIVEARPRLLTLHGRALMPTPQAHEAIALLDRAVEGCLAMGDAVGAAEALGYRASRLSVSGRHDEALGDCARARELLAGREHPILATVLRIEGTIAARQAAFESAMPLLREALAAAQRHRVRAETAMCERALGWVHSFSGDPGAATAYYERAAHIWTELGDLGAAAEVRVSLGYTYAEQGAPELARRSLEQAITEAERTGQRRAHAYAVENLAILDREAGQIDRAIAQLGTALEAARQIDDGQLVMLCLDDLAQCHRIGGKGPGAAETLARQALVEADRWSSKPLKTQATTTLAAVLLARGRHSEALAFARAAAGAAARGGLPAHAVRAHLTAAAAAHGLGAPDWPSSLRAAADALAAASNRGFLRAEVAVLGPTLKEMARDPGAQAAVDAILAAAGEAPEVLAAPEPSPPPLPRIEARLLGRPQVLIDGAPPRDLRRSWGRRATRELFYLLEAHRTGLIGDELAERLWPDALPGRGQALLWSVVHWLRQALGGDDRALGRELVLSSEGVYRLNPELQLDTDVARFEAAAARGLNAAPGSDEEYEALAEADALYRGHYLEGVDSTWVLARRGELARQHRRVLRRLVERALADDGAAAAAEYSERLLRMQPFSETACRLRIRALIAAGDPDRARRVYRAFERRLGDMRELEPSAALRDLVGLGAR